MGSCLTRVLNRASFVRQCYDKFPNSRLSPERGTMRNTLITLVMLSVICSCVHFQRHPDSWNPNQQDANQSGCPQISGLYENIGKDPKGNRVVLANILNYNINHDPTKHREWESTWKELGEAQSVELTLSGDDILTVTATGEGASKTWSFERSKGQFKCEKGMLMLHQRGNGSGDNMVAYESSTIDLIHVNNALVVHRHGGSAGVMLLIPAAGYDSTWARFPMKPTQ